ncbi:MAG: ribosomal protein S18-alanine N-acetyltransferase [Oscillospiraceae bacterium]
MLLIDNMTLEDVSGVTIVEEECFAQPWSFQAFLSELENDKAVTYIAIEDYEVVGFINAHFVLNEGYVNNIAVTLTHRRKHIASMLIEKLVSFAIDKKLAFLTLEVRKSNETAIKLYEKHGFLEVGMRKDFYDQPQEDAILMTRKFDI